MKRLLLFDVDGTLAHSGQNPPASTVDAVRRAREKGHTVMLSTGRDIHDIPHPVARIGFDGGIFNSGGAVYYRDTLVAQHCMPREDVSRIIRFLRETQTHFILETTGGRIRSDDGADLLSQVDTRRYSQQMLDFTWKIIQDPTVLPYSAYTGQQVYKIAYFSADPAVTEQVCRELGQAFTVIPYHNTIGFPLTTGEILDPGITKGRAMMDLCRYLDISPSMCIAFGDSMNDAQILQAAGLGIAMGNAVPELKALADMTCDSCENDGIAKALEELNLI